MSYKSEEPVPHTCPLIDKVIDYIEGVDWDHDDPDEKSLWHEGKIAVDTLNVIRSANNSLRNWGHDLCHERDDLQYEIKELLAKIGNLEHDLENLQSQYDKLDSRYDKLLDAYNEEAYDRDLK